MHFIGQEDPRRLRLFARKLKRLPSSVDRVIAAFEYAQGVMQHCDPVFTHMIASLV
jgi:hypothetical protein